MRKKILILTLVFTLIFPSFVFATENSDENIPVDETVQENSELQETQEENIEQIEQSEETIENIENSENIVSEVQGTADEIETNPVNIEIQVKKNPKGDIELNWNAVENASLYKVKEGENEQTTTEIIFKPVTELNKTYNYTVEAYADEKLIGIGTVEVKTYSKIFDESLYRNLFNANTGAGSFGINLREAIGESHGGYAVSQGAATDGTYAYFLMTSSSNQKGRILKMRLSDHAIVGTGPVINTHHGNGMTFDSKRNCLVIVGYENYRHQLTFVNPSSLTVNTQTDIKYPYTDMEAVQKKYHLNGIAAIAYVPKYDVYVARVRGDVTSGAKNDIMVISAETLNMVGYIRTKVSSAYPGIYQSMAADDKYVYFLLSPKSGQPGNIILCLDWNSENLLPIINGDADHIVKMWKCNNDNSGKPDAVLNISISHESEGLFIIPDSNGKAHFFVTEYYGHQIYKTVTKKEAYKVKWKKVKKKVKWKKVKIKKGKKKGKYKWKYKTKKVWKYKTKYRKVKVQVKDYWARDNYIYDLGIL